MSIQSLLKPNGYNIYAASVNALSSNTGGNINSTGNIFAKGNVIEYSSLTNAGLSSISLTPGEFVNGTVFSTLIATDDLELTLPNVVDIVNYLGSGNIFVGASFDFRFYINFLGVATSSIYSQVIYTGSGQTVFGLSSSGLQFSQVTIPVTASGPSMIVVNYHNVFNTPTTILSYPTVTIMPFAALAPLL